MPYGQKIGSTFVQQAYPFITNATNNTRQPFTYPYIANATGNSRQPFTYHLQQMLQVIVDPVHLPIYNKCDNNSRQPVIYQTPSGNTRISTQEPNIRDQQTKFNTRISAQEPNIRDAIRFSYPFIE